MTKTRKVLLITFIAAAALSLAFAFGCSSDEGGTAGTGTDTEFTGITFTDKTVTYDGTEQSIEISGTLPTGTSVSYTNNTGTDAGTYNASATLSGTGYKTTTLNATLTILKADITGITFADQTFDYDGSEKSFAISGTLPAGLTVSYSTSYTSSEGTITTTEGNTGKDKGVYIVTASISGGDNYNSLTLEAKMTIKDQDLSDFSGITFEDATYTYNGEEMHIEVSGKPDDASVQYVCINDSTIENKATNAGVYEIEAIVTSEGYNYLVLKATLTILKADITSVLDFKNTTHTYTGEEFALTVTGDIPEDITVEYTNNTGTNAGTYEATAVISGNNNYNGATLSATLTISKADITGITFADKIFSYDESEKTIEISMDGDLPEGATVTYTNNTATEAGTYTATVVISFGDNYNDLKLEAKLIIVDIESLATDVIGLLMGTPNAWDFLPEALQQENLATTTSNLKTDFSDWTSVSSINTHFIGLQLSVLYTMLGYAETALTYIDSVNSIGETLASYFQTYINQNPTNYNSYSTSLGGFTINVQLLDDKYALLAGTSTVSIEMYYDTGTGYHSGRVQVTDGIALSYTYTDNYLQMDLMLTVSGVGAYYEITFIRDTSGNTVGYLYEYLGTENTSLTETAAVIASYSDYTFVMSAKRESEDLSIQGYEEIYDSQTGAYVGGEVTETVLSVAYDTYWFNLADVGGITNIKVDSSNFYINNCTTAFANTKVGGISGKMLSRRYDIELKTVYYVIAATDEDGNTTYELQKASIPMIFVQTANISTFGTDIVKANSNVTFTVTPAVPATAVNLLYGTFDMLYDTYTSIYNTLSYQDIVDAIGEKSLIFQTDTTTDGE